MYLCTSANLECRKNKYNTMLRRRRYSHGNLTRSEPLDSHEYEAKQARVEKLSRAAIAIALLARRVASLIRVPASLCSSPPPFYLLPPTSYPASHFSSLLDFQKDRSLSDRTIHRFMWPEIKGFSASCPELVSGFRTRYPAG